MIADQLGSEPGWLLVAPPLLCVTALFLVGPGGWLSDGGHRGSLLSLAIGVLAIAGFILFSLWFASSSARHPGWLGATSVGFLWIAALALVWASLPSLSVQRAVLSSCSILVSAGLVVNAAETIQYLGPVPVATVSFFTAQLSFATAYLAMALVALLGVSSPMPRGSRLIDTLAVVAIIGFALGMLCSTLQSALYRSIGGVAASVGLGLIVGGSIMEAASGTRLRVVAKTLVVTGAGLSIIAPITFNASSMAAASAITSVGLVLAAVSVLVQQSAILWIGYFVASLGTTLLGVSMLIEWDSTGETLMAIANILVGVSLAIWFGARIVWWNSREDPFASVLMQVITSSERFAVAVTKPMKRVRLSSARRAPPAVEADERSSDSVR